jgi:calcineurin-like phosphoesterase
VTRLLFVADVVGPEALAWLCESLGDLCAESQADLVVVNADNAAITGGRPMGGSGFTLRDVELLEAAGADAITCGSHTFDAPDHASALAHPRVLRPANLSVDTPGRGWASLRSGQADVTFVVVAGNSSKLPVGLPVLPEPTVGTRPVVHFVGSTFETAVFAHAVDGDVAAVLGTLGHTRSSAPRHLPKETALLEDVGYTGPAGGIGGFQAAHFIADMQGVSAPLEPYGLVDAPLRLQAVVATIPADGPTDLRTVERSA